MKEDAVVKTLEIDGESFAITVTEKGEFRCYVQGDWFYEETLKVLEDRIRKSVRSTVKVKVPATLLTTHYGAGRKLVPIVVTGIHAGNQKILYRLENGNNGQTGRYGSENILRALTDVERADIMRLWQDQVDLNDKISKLIGSYRLNVPESLAAARKAATKCATSRQS